MKMNAPVGRSSCSQAAQKPICSRPRFLFAVLFAWLSITGGRFLAPYLEQKEQVSVGAFLAVQQAVAIATSPGAGRIADQLEVRYAGQGRIYAVVGGVLIGTISTVAQDISVVSTSESLLLLLRVLYALASSFILPIADGVCVGVCAEDYGKERLWGAVTWAICHVVLGFLVDQFGFTIFFPGSAIAGFLSVWALFVYMKCNERRYDSVRRENTGTTTVHDNDNNDLRGTIAEPGTQDTDQVGTLDLFCKLLIGPTPGTVSLIFGSTFLVAVAVLGAGQAIVDNLVFLYFEFLGSSYTIMGLTVVLTVLIEIPIFQIANHLLRRFGSTGLLQAAMLCYVVRVIGYSLLPSGHVALTLFLEPLHGITYACSQTAVVDFSAQRSPPGHEATFQGFVYTVRGLGAIVGLLWGGHAEETWANPRLLYRAAAVGVGSMSAIMFATVQWQRSSTVKDSSCVELTEHTEAGESDMVKVSEQDK